MRQKRVAPGVSLGLGIIKNTSRESGDRNLDVCRRFRGLIFTIQLPQAYAQCRQNKETSTMLRTPISIALLLVNMATDIDSSQINRS